MCSLVKLILVAVICSTAVAGAPTELQKPGGETVEEALQRLASSYELARNQSSNEWLQYDDSCYVYLYQGGGQPSSNLAGFDLDDTLTKSKSGKPLPDSPTDWELLDPRTSRRVDETVGGGIARFVIFTNQNGVGTGYVSLEDIKRRMELVTEELGQPCTVMVATQKDQFRKPQTGMFELFRQAFNGGLEVDMGNSFFCGDAAGHPAFSDSDLKFAENAGLRFIMPDQFLDG